MADIAGKLYRELQTGKVRATRAQRRAERLSKYEGLGAIVQERTAELKWYLGADSEDGTAIRAGEHPGTAALSVAGATLAQFDMPSGYNIQYKGMSRTSGRGQHAMDEGTITVGVIAPARSGIKAYFDIPLIVKNSRIIDPSVLMHQGLPRILAQSTFDDIFGQKEFHAPPADRSTMFSPPPSKEEAQEIRERPWTTVRRRTVFDVMPKRSNIQAAIRGYTTEEDVRHAQYTRAPPRKPGKATYKIRIKYTIPKSQLGLSDDASEEDVHRTLQRMQSGDEGYEMGGLEMQRESYDVKDVGDGEVQVEEDTYMFYDNRGEYDRRLLPEEVKREVLVPAIEGAGMHDYIIASFRKVEASDWDSRAYVTPTNRIASSYLQEAEREQMLVPKMQVTLSQDVEAKERGGEYYILPEGERMTLLRSLDGTDEGRFEVEDSDGCKWIVPGKSLTKKGSKHSFGRTANHKTVDEAFDFHKNKHDDRLRMKRMMPPGLNAFPSHAGDVIDQFTSERDDLMEAYPGWTDEMFNELIERLEVLDDEFNREGMISQKQGSREVAPKRPFDRKRGFFFNEPPPPPPTPTPTPSGGEGLPESYEGYTITNHYVDNSDEVDWETLVEMLTGALPEGGVADAEVIWTESDPSEVLDTVIRLLEKVYHFGGDETDITVVEAVKAGTEPTEGLSVSDNPLWEGDDD